MGDLPKPYQVIKDEQRGAKKYRRLAEANRKLGKMKNAQYFDNLADTEERHAKSLKKFYKLS